MLRNSSILDKDRIVTEANSAAYRHGLASGSHDMHDAHHKLLKGIWPRTWRVVSITTPTSVTEGSAFSVGITTANIPTGTTLYYTINTLSGAAMTNADFTGSPGNQGISGSWTNTGNNTTLEFTLASSDGTENNTFRVEIRLDSISGEILNASNTVTVTDAVGVDIRSSFYEISNRSVVITTNDFSGNYDVGEVTQSYTGNARVYLAFKCNTSTTFFNDICVAAVQVLNNNGTIKQTWNFSSGSNLNWESRNRFNTNSSLFSSFTTPQSASGFSGYSSLFSGGNNSRITVASSTGSNTTGCVDGIASGTSTVYPVGNGQVSQSFGTSYIYGEVSGANRYSVCIARSPSLNFTAGDHIRVVHNISIPSSMVSTVNTNDALWIGIY